METNLPDQEIIQMILDDAKDTYEVIKKQYFRDVTFDLQKDSEVGKNEQALQFTFESIGARFRSKEADTSQNQDMGLVGPLQKLFKHEFNECLLFLKKFRTEYPYIPFSRLKRTFIEVIKTRAARSPLMSIEAAFKKDLEKLHRHKDTYPDDYYLVKGLLEQEKSSFREEKSLLTKAYANIKRDFFKALGSKYQKTDKELKNVYHKAILKFQNSYIRTGKIFIHKDYTIGLTSTMSAMLITIGANHLNPKSNTRQQRFQKEIMREDPKKLELVEYESEVSEEINIHDDQFLNIILEVLNTFTRIQLLLLFLCDVAKLERKKIADRMEYRNPKSVDVTVSRIRKKLRELVKKQAIQRDVDLEEVQRQFLRWFLSNFRNEDEEE